ncbi:MAG: methyltransferase domain-containing protein [Chthoniobacteraceae bacterium]|nr:methyltransferase domain-containing protein [Chthoniobacteraceae bacterium]
MSSSLPTDVETTIGRIRQEVDKRKGVPASDAPPVIEFPSIQETGKKTLLQKAFHGVERARAKQEKAERWPRPLRGLRRDQEVINKELINSASVLTQEVEQLQKIVFSLANQQVNMLMQHQMHTRQVEGVAEQLAAIEEAISRPAERQMPAAAPSGNKAEQAQIDAFYTALEEQFRGSRALIKERVQEYRPFLQDLKKRIPDAEALDLGCGRGEWLELLKKEEIPARGVDVNARMVEQCRSLGLEAAQGDAITWLQGVPDASLGLISGFHLVEHLPFPVLLRLFRESLRALRPGGMAIFETPNPECLRVSSYTFYFDPTHRNPLPPELLSFIATHAGFSTVHIERLHLNTEENVFKGYGDYAGIFTK